MKWKSLTTENALIMKGIAILMIAIHNFMHLFPFPKENEFDFSLDRTMSMVTLLWETPEKFIQVLFSFFGHLGVAVFIFLSAYGLSKKYQKNPPIFWTFISERIFKIFPAFLIAIVIWLTLEGLYSYGILGPFKMLSLHYQDIILKLTLLSNFIPDKALSPIGPWWFIPFIFQFYVVFPLLLRAYDHWKTNGLVLISFISLALATLANGNFLGVNLYYTVLPYMPIFTLGIYLAKNDEHREIHISLSVILATLVIFIASNINQYVWVLSHFTFTILFLLAMKIIIPKLKGKLYSFLLFTGQISMGLFLVNGFLRSPMIHWAIAKDNWLITIGLCLVFLVISYVLAMTVLRLENFITQKIKILRYKHSHAG